MTYTSHKETADPALAHIAALFDTAQVVAGPTLVDCTLSGGTEATCFSITVHPLPTTYTPGPWCPTSIDDGPEAAGIWLHNGTVYDADGAFMSRIGTLLDDDTWQMVDPNTGAISVTTTQDQCAAAARPDVGAEYANFCVECQTDYLPDDTAITYVIPLAPVDQSRDQDIRQTGSGVAINGVRFDGPAPVEAIFGAYTVAPFDDCGGHVNLNVGYHYHAATDCLETEVSDDAHASQIGVAMDGYGIFTHLLSDGTLPEGLDGCYGHATDAEGYHYHAGAAGSNQILGCLSAEAGCVLFDGKTICDASARRPRP